MEKSTKGNTTAKKSVPPKPKFMENLFKKLFNTNLPVSASGKAINLYYSQAGIGKEGLFRKNQRKERSRSRRRSTKPSARN